MKASEETLATDELVSESGRVFRPYHKEILDALPQDIVAELARRRLKELEENAEIAHILATQE